MAFPKVPSYTKNILNKAARAVVQDETDEVSLNIMSEWRACHAYPINTFQSNLRRKVKSLDLPGTPIVAQRLKRMPTIIDKLKRYPMMNFSQMQDIGGVRAVVDTYRDVQRLEQAYKNKSKFSSVEHRLLREKNYILSPRTEDGYRSLHLIYEYKNRIAPEYNGLLLELQIRTRLQHTWATAVETMGIYLNQPLKTRKGEQKWIDYFALVSNAFAQKEKLPLIPRYSHLSEIETCRAIAHSDSDLKVLDRLSGFAQGAALITTKAGGKGFYHLITLDIGAQKVNVKAFTKANFNQAKREYAEVEKRAAMGEKLEPVLVAVGSIGLLERAYPNFFLDTRDFVYRVEQIIRKSERLF